MGPKTPDGRHEEGESKNEQDFFADGSPTLDRIVTMDESAVSFHTPETK
jgi:hypothetical protein